MGHSAPPVPTETTPAYDLYEPAVPAGPVVVSVPHAGRDYDAALLAQARVRRDVLQRLEDRWADMLAYPLVDQGVPVLVARVPRAAIDLNRHEREIDAAMVGGIPRDVPLQSSAKLRGGLGLIPRRLPGAHELWQRSLGWAEVVRRIELFHRPYHATLARLMRAARDAYGHAILIDLHSMPPLPPPTAGQAAAGLVLGDRFGRSASARLMTLAADVAAAHGIAVAQNHPYAGDHMVERHGRPMHGLYAIQVECDRSLYLDEAMDQPGPGLAAMQKVVAAIVNALAHELPRSDYAMAAE
ncbi:N-formylglutamate deformylase [Sphingobium sp. TA15]|uniref:N-formylglutamate amidohydrolase n=1 Tax=Sphingobium indicum (strain DSM 16413 / CCM 7287 / MTCC 6362 / UT26 / NBRC 101211 / UT26S) TaxID=452662 RepID=D4Z587_SPHIU|nr:N-formylglutamate amidohydrolase [Sphingobium indicum]BAI97769.1 N-formylglutamate amidohydrolase [Sphingobium indicum UT26S]BDD67170.1 N-formylglutamate deformylase [Sphingobium sp. TA15]